MGKLLLQKPSTFSENTHSYYCSSPFILCNSNNPCLHWHKGFLQLWHELGIKYQGCPTDTQNGLQESLTCCFMLMNSSARVPAYIFICAHNSFHLMTSFSQNSSITQKEALEDILKLNRHHKALPVSILHPYSVVSLPLPSWKETGLKQKINQQPLHRVTLMGRERCGWDGEQLRGHIADHHPVHQP